MIFCDLLIYVFSLLLPGLLDTFTAFFIVLELVVIVGISVLFFNEFLNIINGFIIFIVIIILVHVLPGRCRFVDNGLFGFRFILITIVIKLLTVFVSVEILVIEIVLILHNIG